VQAAEDRCAAFDEQNGGSRTSAALAGLCRLAAASSTCPVFLQLEYGPDAYRSQDLPREGGEPPVPPMPPHIGVVGCRGGNVQRAATA
jgi:hypothetical protein